MKVNVLAKGVLKRDTTFRNSIYQADPRTFRKEPLSREGFHPRELFSLPAAGLKLGRVQHILNNRTSHFECPHFTGNTI